MNKITIRVVFCDDSTQEEFFEPTSFDKLNARDAWNRYCAIGSDNFSVFGKTPHVTQVHYVEGDKATSQPYLCPCVRSRGEVIKSSLG